MNKNQFTGVANGNVSSSPHELKNEALLVALDQARTSLQTDYLKYKIISTSGEYGGFVEVHNVSVTIEVTATE